MKGTITNAEWEIMRIIWADAPLTSRQIIDRALTILGWKEGTVKSLLSRLSQKDAIHKETSVTPFLFSATISQHEATCIALDQCLANTCAKDCRTYLEHLIATKSLSQSDCEHLIDLLQTKRADAPQTVPCNCPAGQCSCHHTKGAYP